MAGVDLWTDRLDPSPEELRAALPSGLHESALEQLEASAQHDDEPRPKLESHGDYVFGVFLIPVVIPEEDLVYYQELDLIVTGHALLTVRKTPESGRAPLACQSAPAAFPGHEPPGLVVHHLGVRIAERQP